VARPLDILSTQTFIPVYAMPSRPPRWLFRSR